MSILVDHALKTRKCTSCKLPIKKDETCIHYQAGFGATSYSGNLCLTCLATGLSLFDIKYLETLKFEELTKENKND